MPNLSLAQRSFIREVFERFKGCYRTISDEFSKNFNTACPPEEVVGEVLRSSDTQIREVVQELKEEGDEEVEVDVQDQIEVIVNKDIIKEEELDMQDQIQKIVNERLMKEQAESEENTGNKCIQVDAQVRDSELKVEERSIVRKRQISEQFVDDRILRDVFLPQPESPSRKKRSISGSWNLLSSAFTFEDEKKGSTFALQTLRNAALRVGVPYREERRSLSLGSQSSAFNSPRPGTDFIEQNTDLNSSAGLEILKLDNVESFFNNIYPQDSEVKVAEWNHGYNPRPFMPVPAAAGRVSNTSVPAVRPCTDHWVAPFNAPISTPGTPLAGATLSGVTLAGTTLAVPTDDWSPSNKQVYSLSPTTQPKEDLTMDRSVSSTTFLGEDTKDNRFDVLATPYYPYGVTSPSVTTAYPPFSHYTCPTKSPYYQDRSKECYQCSASGYTTTLFKTNTGRNVCENCSHYAVVQAPASRTSKNPKRRMAGGNKRQGTACNNCGTQKTTLWRRDATGQAVCNACGLYYKLHQQNRPQNMKKDTIQSRNRKPGRKNTKKKVELEQLGAVAATSYQEQMMSLQQQIPPHMIHPGQLIGTKQEGMINPLYSQSALMKQEQVAQYHYNMNHMIPPPLVESPTLSPSSTLNALSPPSKEEQLGFLSGR